jgi:hypothetical protein
MLPARNGQELIRDSGLVIDESKRAQTILNGGWGDGDPSEAVLDIHHIPTNRRAATIARMQE